MSQLFGAHSSKVHFTEPGVPPIEVHTVRPAFRAGREGRQIEQVVVTLTQRVAVDIGPPGEPRPMVFRGGSSLIFNLGNLNTVDYVIVKNITSYDRFRAQAEYLNGETDVAPLAASTYEGDDRSPRIRFNLLHRF